MRNIFENPTTVQFNHRVLGTLTFISSLSWAVFIEKNKHLVPRSTLNLSRLIALVASNQVGLGIATLVYLVPTNLALLHQANSLLLLSVSLSPDSPSVDLVLLPSNLFINILKLCFINLKPLEISSSFLLPPL
ncbi:Cytochrome c oxidase assembly protein cox15 [Puccinia graminis f. sp. tritici]|uniref:Cytochrome c oxidase assembly protein cox15 n=1 Tax=Puccinia graminis f. sp. tritici TaxID=56615 RepID=A0A5B0PS95_PUCGR|nr:Cytochrome c oxidase assembly protein cox15 [Puccinia graminis f. sp. tritici]